MDRCGVSLVCAGRAGGDVEGAKERCGGAAGFDEVEGFVEEFLERGLEGVLEGAVLVFAVEVEPGGDGGGGEPLVNGDEVLIEGRGEGFWIFAEREVAEERGAVFGGEGGELCG